MKNELASLGKRISKMMDIYTKHAIEIGENLKEVKEVLHNDDLFERWCLSKLHMDVDTAKHYMKMFEASKGGGVISYAE